MLAVGHSSGFGRRANALPGGFSGRFEPHACESAVLSTLRKVLETATRESCISENFSIGDSECVGQWQSAKGKDLTLAHAHHS